VVFDGPGRCTTRTLLDDEAVGLLTDAQRNARKINLK
jgi:hypothetical protein